jgi:integrase
MYISGCRISEVLAIRGYDISTNGLIKIKGKKGSNDKIIRITQNISHCKTIPKNLNMPFKIYSRFFIYRLFKKIGLIYKSYGNINNSVTHYFRKSVALEAYNISKDQQDIKLVLNHKSIKSAHYYDH